MKKNRCKRTRCKKDDSFNTLLLSPRWWKDAFPFLGNGATNGNRDKFCLDYILAIGYHGDGVNAFKAYLVECVILEWERIDHFWFTCFLEPRNQWSRLDWAIIKCNGALDRLACRTKIKEKGLSTHSDDTVWLTIQLRSTQGNIQVWVENDPRFHCIVQMMRFGESEWGKRFCYRFGIHWSWQLVGNIRLHFWQGAKRQGNDAWHICHLVFTTRLVQNGLYKMHENALVNKTDLLGKKYKRHHAVKELTTWPCKHLWIDEWRDVTINMHVW